MVSLNPEAALARELFAYSLETGLLTKKETGKSDWCKQKHGHMLTWFLGRKQKVHRVIWLLVTGENQATATARLMSWACSELNTRLWVA